MVTRGGYDCAWLYDFDDGPDIEDFFALFRKTMIHVAEQSRDQVSALTIGIGGLFEKTVIQKYMNSIQAEVDRLRDAEKPEEDRGKEQAKRSVDRLNKLGELLGGGGRR